MWRSLRAALGLVRLLMHLVHGVWTVRRSFPRWSNAQREDAVQRWAQAGLRILGIELQVGGAAPCPGPVLLVANAETGARFEMNLAWVVLVGIVGIVVDSAAIACGRSTPSPASPR